MDQGNLDDHRAKQDRLRRLIVQQGNVISRTTRYENRYYKNFEKMPIFDENIFDEHF